MELTPKEQAIYTCKQYIDLSSKICARIDIQGKIDLLSELNQTKLCKFDKEIDYWNEVLKELDSL